MRPLILVGGGGHCKSVIDAIESIDRKIHGILDVEGNIGKKVLNYPIIGKDEDIHKYVGDYEFVVTVGSITSPTTRIQIYNKIKNCGGRLANIFAQSSHISKYSRIDEGCVVLNNATINANTKIGKCCIINTGAIIEHDVTIGDFTHISTGALINGSSSIGNESFIGSGAIVCNNISIGDQTIVGAGGVVCKDINGRGIYIGMPVKRIR